MSAVISANIIAALRTISEAALTWSQVKALLESKEITEEAVDEALTSNKAELERLKRDD